MADADRTVLSTGTEGSSGEALGDDSFGSVGLGGLARAGGEAQAGGGVALATGAGAVCFISSGYSILIVISCLADS